MAKQLSTPDAPFPSGLSPYLESIWPLSNRLSRNLHECLSIRLRHVLNPSQIIEHQLPAVVPNNNSFPNWLLARVPVLACPWLIIVFSNVIPSARHFMSSSFSTSSPYNRLHYFSDHLTTATCLPISDELTCLELFDRKCTTCLGIGFDADSPAGACHINLFLLAWIPSNAYTYVHAPATTSALALMSESSFNTCCKSDSTIESCYTLK